MGDFREHRAAMKFCFLLGKNATETPQMLRKATKDDVRKTLKCLSGLKNGDMSIDDKLCSGRPSAGRTHENV